MRNLLTDGSLSPRGQHYYFAHAAVKALAFEDPERLVIALAAPGADEFLVEMWHAVGKDAIAQTGNERDGNLPADGLEAIPARVAGRPTALVRLPTPVATTEAYFVAITGMSSSRISRSTMVGSIARTSPTKPSRGSRWSTRISPASSPDSPTAVRVGDRPPDFTLPDETGRPVSLADYRGTKPVVLLFYRGYW